MNWPHEAPILGLHGVPRSGTTWLGQILNSAPEVAYRFQPFFAWAFRDRIEADPDAAALERILGEIAVSDDDFLHQRGKGLIARREVSFAKTRPTRLVYKEVRYHQLLPRLMQVPRFRGLGLIRSPIETLASWAANPREFDPAWDLAAEWRAAPSKNQGRPGEFFGYEAWKRAARLFEQLAASEPDRFRIVAYADLVRDPLRETEELFAFAGLGLTDQTRAFIARSTTTADDDPYGVMRDLSDRAAPALPAAIVAAIRTDLKGDPLERFL